MAKFYPTLAPQQNDSVRVLIDKSVQLLNALNGGAVSNPTFFPEGSEVRSTDTRHRLLQKMAGATQVYGDNF